MYPTWEPSEHGEKARIATKYGKVSSPPHSSVASHKDLPTLFDLDVQPSRKRTLLMNHAEHEPTSEKTVPNIEGHNTSSNAPLSAIEDHAPW